MFSGQKKYRGNLKLWNQNWIPVPNKLRKHCLTWLPFTGWHFILSSKTICFPKFTLAMSTEYAEQWSKIDINNLLFLLFFEASLWSSKKLRRWFEILLFKSKYLKARRNSFQLPWFDTSFDLLYKAWSSAKSTPDC